MTLTLEITTPNAAELGEARRKSFGVEGGVIGRNKSSAWVLPHNKVSGRHAVITFDQGVFYIEDTSTNGVFIKSTRSRLGKGRRYPLRAGDSLFIDPYAIEVSISASPESWPQRDPRPAPLGDPFGNTDPFGSDPMLDRRAAPPPGQPGIEQAFGPVAGEEVDPMKLFGGSGAPGSASSSAQARTPLSANDLETGSPLRQYYKAPAIVPPAPAGPPAPRPPDRPGGFVIPEGYNPLEESNFGIPPQARPGPAPGPAPIPAPKPAAIPAPIPAAEEPRVPQTQPHQVDPFPDPPRPFVPPVTPERLGADPGAFTPPPAVSDAAAAMRPGPGFADDNTIIKPRPAPVPVPAAIATPAPVRAPAPPENRPAPAAPDDGARIDLRQVLEGAGLRAEDVTPDLARDFGRILRVVVAGVMEILVARQQLKDEFRLRATQFRLADNNPLKFSVNVDDALHNLLVKRNAAFLGPVAAFDDAFGDLRHHQIAMLAGMRKAFESMMAQFDPAHLQEDFAKRAAMLGKLRYWDLYTEHMAALNKDPDKTFRDLFGEEFAREYEVQLQRLRAADRDNAMRETRGRGEPGL